MLGSCSKDDTEIAPVNGDNEVIFTAGMTIGDETRTGIAVDPNDPQHTVYTWDFGDMVGVSVASGKIVPFINLAASGSATANFGYAEEDADYVGEGNAAYFVYPYNEDNVVTMSGRNAQVTLSVPATQRYRNDSFAPMTAPAVAYTDSFKKGDGYTFKAVTSFIRVPLIGNGTLKGLKMKIDNGADALKIAGSNTVIINSTTPELKAATDGWSDEISIDFGNGGLELSLTKKQYVVFVVPAGLEIKANTKFTLTATLEGADVSESVQTYSVAATYPQKTLPVNIMLTIGGGNGILFGTENQILINTTEDFLKYVYSVNQGTASADASYVNNGKFKTAFIMDALNYNRYDAGAAYAANAAKGDAKDELLEAALQEYMTNGGFAPIKAGANIDGNGNTISYMTVNGNGIFAGAAASLKNVTFSNITVNVPDGQKTSAAFIGKLPSLNANSTTVSNVKFVGGFLKNVAEGVVPAMVASATATTLPTVGQITITSYPHVNETTVDAYYAATLTVNGDVVASDRDKKAYFLSQTPRFAVIKGSKAGAVISKVSAGKAVENIIAAVDPKSAQAFSVIDNRGTSYWTGLSAAAGDGKINTAEELAYYVKNGGTATLAANIDLQGEHKEWVLDNGSVALNITGNGKYTISNALVKSQKVNGYVAYSLLGNVVNAKDIVVDGVTIDVAAVEGSTAQLYVGGLGYQGSANGVKVSNMTINVAADVKVSTYNEIGGLISAPSAASKGNTVSDISININGNETVGPVGGLFGILNRQNEINFDGNSVGYKDAAEVKYPLLGAWTVYASTDVAACSVVGSTEENPIAPVVGVITFNPTNVTPGTQIWLNFVDECSAPYYSEIKNGVDYAYNVKINGNEVPVDKPE